MFLQVTNGQAFYWLSQLRHRWDEQQRQCLANICDVQFFYSYQYLENTPRLVITPSLAGQCYITLTQSLHLTKSGTTKDLGGALGIMVYVFNCSEQMDLKPIGNIFKGLDWRAYLMNSTAALVHAAETAHLRYFMDLLLERGQPLMLVGNAGVENTSLVRNQVDHLTNIDMTTEVPLNYYCTSLMLQSE
ncbi:dynein beta chain, ciliary [Oncorhynchus tshawytscha]|uniref:dynein beta chain, ciliary n=1 Tax=Oncorhynchus tshawytscha TaxID=74940 RepID=UPI001C3CBC8A|nr:dynein beta chain, ciliary [Oncorhynchus tshawytscha]